MNEQQAKVIVEIDGMKITSLSQADLMFTTGDLGNDEYQKIKLQFQPQKKIGLKITELFQKIIHH